MSRDSVASHSSFAADLQLPFPILADTQDALCNAYGTLAQREREDGSTYLGIQRSTFLIDPNGIIRNVWPKVSVPGHAADVLASLKELSAT